MPNRGLGAWPMTAASAKAKLARPGAAANKEYPPLASASASTASSASAAATAGAPLPPIRGLAHAYHQYPTLPLSSSSGFPSASSTARAAYPPVDASSTPPPGTSLPRGPAEALPSSSHGHLPLTKAPGKRSRPLYRAEQLMEDRNLRKKKYLATQRLRRDIERSSIESLRLDVNGLRQQIADLRTMREIVANQRATARATQSASRLTLVQQYFAAMVRGIGREPPRSPSHGGNGGVDLACSRQGKLDFLRSLFDEDMQFGVGRGFAAFVEQCAFYTLFHATFRQGPVRLEELPQATEPAVIVARNDIFVRISRTTLEQIFPHVLNDEELVQDLIGREVTYPCEIRIYFDEQLKIVRHDATVDFVTGLNTVLANLPRVGRVMKHANLQGAIITPRPELANDTTATTPPASPRSSLSRDAKKGPRRGGDDGGRRLPWASDSMHVDRLALEDRDSWSDSEEKP